MPFGPSKFSTNSLWKGIIVHGPSSLSPLHYQQLFHLLKTTWSSNLYALQEMNCAEIALPNIIVTSNFPRIFPVPFFYAFDNVDEKVRQHLCHFESLRVQRTSVTGNEPSPSCNKLDKWWIWFCHARNLKMTFHGFSGHQELDMEPQGNEAIVLWCLFIWFF